MKTRKESWQSHSGLGRSISITLLKYLFSNKLLQCIIFGTEATGRRVGT